MELSLSFAPMEPVRDAAEEPVSDGIPEEPACDASPRATPADDASTVLAPVPCADNRPPAYPREARRRGYEGVVILTVHVSTEGACLAVDLEESSGHSSLDRAALAAVRRWRFEPARRNGVPVEAQVEVPIRFQLIE
jgi:protein TonB